MSFLKNIQISPFIQSLSIKNKLILTILSITLTITILSFATIIIYGIRDFREEMVNNMQMNAKLIAEYCVTPLAFNDQNGAQETLNKLKSIPQVSHAILYDDNDSVFVEIIVHEKEAFIPKPALAAYHDFIIGKLITFEPIIYDNLKYGSILIYTSTKILVIQIRNYIILMIVIMLGMILLSYILANWMQKYISGPILVLTQFTSKISEEGDYSQRIEKSGNDEIGVLYDQFNEMLTQLQKREKDKEIAEKFKIEKETAEASNKAKSLFLANMSHEIRTPLNAILGFSQIMQKDKSLSNEQKGNLETINSSGEHLLSLINEILEMSKIEAGKVMLNNTSFDLQKLLEDMYTMFRLRTEKKNLNFDIHINSNLPHFINSDEGKIRQVLINLLGNAIKFTNEGGIILRANATNEADQIRIFIEVEDTGIGIHRDEINKIFQHFERSKNVSTRHGGTGLGLAISKEYAHMMNGEIRVQSELGKGSSFGFEFIAEPASKDDVISSEPYRKIKGIDSAGKKVKVLVADDKKANRELLRKILELTGFTVECCSNGVEAIDNFINWKPDLILMDIFMPDMDGFEAIKRIRAMDNGKDIVIFAVTASVFEEDKQSVIEVGADEFIKKPFKEYEILELIAKYLKIAYIYEEEDTTDAEDKLENLNEVLENIDTILKTIDIKIITKIRESIVLGDRDAICKYAIQIKEVNEAYYSAICDAAENFDFEVLNKLLQLET